MAGAGIGKCVICGRDNQPLISDICQDCHMKEFNANLEDCPLSVGDVVFALNSSGQKVFNSTYQVAEDFQGGWMDRVKLRLIDEGGLLGDSIIERGRDKITKL